MAKYKMEIPKVLENCDTGQKYDVIDEIGSGSFGKCYCVKQEDTGEIYACKILEKAMSQMIHTEIEVHAKLKHEHVVQMISSFENTQFVFIILTMCENSSISNLLEQRVMLSLQESKYMLHQILLGLIYVHSQNIIHMDLKPDNILLDINLQVKLADFGLAIHADDKRAKTIFAGTLPYMAPEIIARKGASMKSDIWSIGVIVYEMLYGEMPFMDDNRYRLQNLILQGSYRLKPQTDEEFKSFLESSLERVSSKRLTAKKCLQHNFLAQHEIPGSLSDIFSDKKVKEEN